MDDTVFNADSHGMFLFSRNEKVTALLSYFFLYICEEIQTLFLQMDLKSLFSLSEEDALNIFQDYDKVRLVLVIFQ